MMFINTVIDDMSLKISCNFLFYLLTSTILGFLLAADNLSPIETSAFFHEKLFGLQSSSPENGFLTYQNTAGLTMGYPPEWERVEPGGQAQGFVGFRSIEGSAAFIVGAKNVDISPEFWDNKDSLGITLSEGKKGND